MSWAALDELDFDVIGSDESLALGALEQVGRVTARADVTGLSDDELLLGVGQVERARRSADATEAHLLAELAARGLTDERRGLRTGQWIAHESREPVAAATRRVSIATRLRDEFPMVDQALTEGRIGWIHAQTLVEASNPRIAQAFLDKVPLLIGLAEELPFKPWAKHVRDLAFRLDYDGGYRPEDDPTASRASIDTLADTTFLRAAFPGATGAEVRQIVETRTDRLWRQFQRDHKTSNGAIKVPTRTELRGMAMAELFRAGHAADPGSTTGPVTDLSLVLRVDLTDLLPGGLTPNSAFGGGASPSKLIADGRYFTSRFYDTGDGCELCGETIETRLCDAALNVLVTDDQGVPLKLGRTTRFATEGQRRAARLRDGGCVFPGCDRPASWCDCHHVESWLHGGLTNIDHLACLCRFHHGVTHRNGWNMHADGNGWFYWTTPRGDTLHSQRHHQPRAGPTPITP